MYAQLLQWRDALTRAALSIFDLQFDLERGNRLHSTKT